MTNSDFKVFMMGGRYCGRTSVLSSLFYQIINGEANKILTLTDRTNYSQMTIKGHLYSKQLELRDTIERGGNRTFIVDKNPRCTIGDYVIRVNFPKKPKPDLDIAFRIPPGEFFEANSIHCGEILQFMREGDVFIIAVDTPYLMSDRRGIAEVVNRISEIHTFLTEINARGKDGEKMVIFVPVKCEKWMAEGKIDEVIAKIKKYYGASIKVLDAAENIKMSIIAVETAGGIHFNELREALTIYKPGWDGSKECSCTEEDGSIVILRDGTPHFVCSDEFVKTDMNAIFADTNIHRPNAWYHIPKDATYAPRNCDQLLLHILRFLFKKKLDGIALATVAPLIKDAGDGIVHIK